MKPINIIPIIFSAAVIVIGFIMIIKFAGKALPPALSGIAFILTGIMLLTNIRIRES